MRKHKTPGRPRKKRKYTRRKGVLTLEQINQVAKELEPTNEQKLIEHVALIDGLIHATIAFAEAGAARPRSRARIEAEYKWRREMLIEDSAYLLNMD